MSRTQKFFPSTCLALAGLAGLTFMQPASAAESAQTLPIKKISADASQELVIEFAAKSFPTAPQVLDLPGPNHRVVIDFTDASVDKGAVQSAEELSKTLASSIPFIKAVRYSELENAPKPTARLVIDLPESVKVKPRVVKLEEGMVVIGFSDQPIQTSQAPAEPPSAETASNAESNLRPAMPEETKAPETTEAAQPAEKTPAAATGTDDKKAAADTNPKLESVKLYNKAVQLHLAGKLSEAIIAYKEALESNKALAEAHSNLGLIYNQQHNYAQALSEFRKALAINPKDAITYNGIGAALRAEHDLQGAIKNWQTAVSLDAKLATAHYNLGTAYEIQKDYEKSMASYRAAVKNDYRLGEAYYRMGLIMERKNRSEEAAEQFKEALKVSGDSEYSEDARQRLVYLQGKKGKTQ
ncbi:MAG: tetratricopeptide repeat protein [Candidatus Obscuribacterales bacterium]|jgi:tetratricopeptide (TPR) repeat protein|nr:tetratricopeptide repeat protein [Candidatus Obscuribacterales bacterium]